VIVQVAEELQVRARNKLRRLLVNHGARRPFVLDRNVPYISFTFDDFPRSAFLEGGRILQEHGVRGTYFISLQLLDTDTCVGSIASGDDLRTLLRQGHELGCHTFSHLDGCHSTVDAFERSIAENHRVFKSIVPDGRFPVFAYPLDGPVLGIKRAVGKHFVCCRGGGQTFNSGAIDLNLLKAYFLDWRNQDNLSTVRELIERNHDERGWLVFATHDVTEQPSRYGCSPEFFGEVVRLAVRSGARVVPMMKACEELQIV
jgi:peptidoglycan/xylan/chitin deacetylase (PgdA/CDA1 family)